MPLLHAVTLRAARKRTRTRDRFPSSLALFSATLLALAVLSCSGDDGTTEVTDPPPEECPPGQVETPTGCEEPPPEGCPTGQVETPSGCVEPLGQVEPDLPVVSDARLVGPLRVRLTPSGRLLVADSRAGMVFLMDADATAPGQGLEVPGKPLSVALLGDRVYVGVEADQTVQAYQAVGGDADASFGAGAVGRPADMVADTVEGLLFVLDGLERAVKVFDPDGSLVRTIGEGSLTAPTALGLDPARRQVLVSDYGPMGGPASVQRFGYEGAAVDTIDGTGEFDRPQGAAVDGDGRIYLADALLASVLVFDGETLEVLGMIGGRDAGAGGLRLPTSVAVDTAGNAIVASFAAGEVRTLTGGAP